MAKLDKRLRHADHIKIIKEDGKPWRTVQESINPSDVKKHWTNGTKVGVPFIRRGEDVTITAMIDLDDHDGKCGWENIKTKALEVIEELMVRGLTAMPYRSRGGKGINLWLAWDEVQDAYSVREQLRSVVEECGLTVGAGGVDIGQVEVFPKQSKIGNNGDEDKNNGSCAAIPFQALDIWTLEDMPEDKWSEVEWVSSKSVPVVVEAPVLVEGSVDIIELSEEKIDELLAYCDPSCSYDAWFELLASIKSAGGTREQALEWSQEGSNYTKNCLSQSKWDGLGREGGITARTLIKKARDAGWDGDVVEASVDDFEAMEGGAELDKQQSLDCAVSSVKVNFLANFVDRLKRVSVNNSNIKIDIHIDKLRMILPSCYYDNKRAKYFALTSFGKLNVYNEQQALKMIKRDLGYYYDHKKYEKDIEGYMDDQELNKGLSKAESIKESNRLKRLPWKELLEYVVLCSQYTRANHTMDMFAEHGQMKLGRHKVDVIYKWHPLRAGGDKINNELVDDFKQHFPEFDDVIELMVNSRFAKDRKKAYLWLHCDSDWGKSFLISVLNDLDLSIEMSPQEAEAMIESKPVAKTELDFVESFVTVFEEFKSVKSGLKQLESSISFSPKNASEITVQLYLKLFLSANDVPSLAGSRGVEDQFSNRFSLIRGKGRLNDRKLFSEHQGEYFTSVRNYVALYVNNRVAEMQDMGKYDSVTIATNGINEFHSKYNIGSSRGKISDNINEVVEEFRATAIRHVNSIEYGAFKNAVKISGEHIVLLKPTRVISDWIDTEFDKSEQMTWKKLKSDMKDLIDPEGLKNRRIAGGTQTKCIILGDINDHDLDENWG